MFKFDNNVLGQLASSVSVSATSISIAVETGINNPPPDPAGGTAFLTLVDNLANPTKTEIITYSGRTGTGPYTLTGVVKGQESTADQSWNAGEYIFQAQTAASLHGGIMNPQNINYDLAVPANYNARLLGPVTMASGKTLTVNSGATLEII